MLWTYTRSHVYEKSETSDLCSLSRPECLSQDLCSMLQALWADAWCSWEKFPDPGSPLLSTLCLSHSWGAPELQFWLHLNVCKQQGCQLNLNLRITLDLHLTNCVDTSLMNLERKMQRGHGTSVWDWENKIGFWGPKKQYRIFTN